jgi:archaellum component FlaC
MESSELERRLDRIDETLKRIECAISQMDTDVRGMQITTQRMDNHISFVETVYQSVQRPFHALMSAANHTFVGRRFSPMLS